MEYPSNLFFQIFNQNLLNHPLTLLKGSIGSAQQDFSIIDLNHEIFLLMI